MGETSVFYTSLLPGSDKTGSDWLLWCLDLGMTSKGPMAFLAPHLGDPEDVGCSWPQRPHQLVAEGMKYGADIHCRSTCSSLQPAQDDQSSQQSSFQRILEQKTRLGNFKHRSLIKASISLARTTHWYMPYPATVWRVQKSQGCTLTMAKILEHLLVVEDPEKLPFHWTTLF